MLSLPIRLHVVVLVRAPLLVDSLSPVKPGVRIMRNWDKIDE